MSQRLSDYKRSTGAKYDCAFCGSERYRRPCGFHAGDMARLLFWRQVEWFVTGFVVIAGLTIAALLGWFA